MDIQPDLSVCVVPTTTDIDLVSCVESILAQNDPVLLEVFVPTGCGLESTFSDRPEVQFVDYPHGRHGANIYHVWQQATGRYLAVFYSSIIVGPGCFFAMLEFLDGQPDVGATAPRFLSENNELMVNCFQSSLPFLPPKKMKYWNGRSSLQIDWMSPEALFTNKVAFEECAAKVFSGKNWSRDFCKYLRAKGWHQFFVHYSKVICRSFL